MSCLLEVSDAMYGGIAELHARLLRGAIRSSDVIDECRQAVETIGRRLNCVLACDWDRAFKDAERLDELIRTSGILQGPLHGVPILVKDQIDVAGLPTTLGSRLLEHFVPENDAHVVAKLRVAGAIILGKTTLGEFGAGDSYGSLYGATSNPYDVTRTAGGSSGGSAAAVSGKMCIAALGQEGVASISRPSAWNCVVGMRPTAGLVSRSGAFSGWPNIASSIGPMARSVDDVRRVLDAIVGYDSEDPSTRHAYVGRGPRPGCDRRLPRAPRVGILRTSIGHHSDQASRDYADVTEAFNESLQGLAEVATMIDPIAISEIARLLRERAFRGIPESFDRWMSRGGRTPYMTHADVISSEHYRALDATWPDGAFHERSTKDWGTYLAARDALRSQFLEVMAERDLDAVAFRAAEHTATPISEGISPPYVNGKGAVSLNTFLVDFPTVTVPGAFTQTGMPTGITFMGRPFGDDTILDIAEEYESVTQFRIDPPVLVDA